MNLYTDFLAFEKNIFLKNITKMSHKYLTELNDNISTKLTYNLNIIEAIENKLVRNYSKTYLFEFISLSLKFL